MPNRDFSRITIVENELLIRQQDIHSVESRFSILTQDNVDTPVPLASGYLMLQGKTIALYNFDEFMRPIVNACSQHQMVVLLKYNGGLFALICNDITPTETQVQLRPIPESMDISPSPFRQYALIEERVTALIDCSSLIEYLDQFNQRLLMSPQSAA
jgi:CheW-like domain